jgi:hypothetical protein
MVCGLAGATWGWFASKATFKDIVLVSLQKKSQQDAAFILPSSPPMVFEQPKEEAPTDFSTLRIWEVTAHQPLPPRKEPLTGPNWKVVGVTSVDADASILLLFDKQTEVETRKVGDLLPGGAKIVKITQDAVRIYLNKETMELRLRKQ